MKKVSVLIISVLFIVLSATVVWQWVLYSNKTGQVTSKPVEDIIQSVTVKVDQKGLAIKQVFNNLQNGSSYGAITPEQATDLVCTTSDGAPCQYDLETNSIKAKGDSLQFEYFIKFDPAAVEFILNDWLVLLSEPGTTMTRIEIVDRIHPKGTWVAGLPVKGYRQMEVVDYYVFEGKGENPSIYWENKGLNKFSGQRGIHYYSSSKEHSGIYQFDSLKTFAENDHMSVVFNNDNRIVHGNGLLLAPSSLSKNELKKQLAISLLSRRFQGLKPDERGVLDALASLVTNEPATTSKNEAIVSELQTKLTTAELSEFILLLGEGGSDIDHSVLDERLASIKGMHTNFFTLNKQDETGPYPLLFNDGRRLIANGQEVSDWDVVIEGDKELFPLKETLSLFGFDIKSDPNLNWIKVKSSRSLYSFNLKNKTFVTNEQTFGLLESPFKKINGKVFIEKQWLEAIFKLSIEESEEEIVLSK
jgi:hypothetical protein